MVLSIKEQSDLINEFKGRIPVDVEGLAKALGLQLKYEVLDPEIVGMIEKSFEGTYVVKINKDDPKTRQRFTIAHELGHYLLHFNKIGSGIVDGRMYRSTATEGYPNQYIGKKEETEANQFAAGLLMPLRLIEALKAQGITDPKEMAEKLIVSKRAMEIRLGIGTS